jgi:hypothetical protein
MKNLDTPLLETRVEEDVLDQDEWGYQASFAQLESISGKQFAKRLSKNIGQDPLVVFVNMFAHLNQSKGGQVSNIEINDLVTCPIEIKPRQCPNV